MTALLWPLGGILLVLIVVFLVNRGDAVKSSAAFGWLRDLQIFTTDRFGTLVLGAAQSGAGALLERSGGDERLQVVVQLSRTQWPLVHDRQREFEYRVAELIDAELYERAAGQVQPEFTVMANLDIETENYRIVVRVAPDVTQRPSADGEPGSAAVESIVARIYVGGQRAEFPIPAGGYLTVGHRDRAPSPPSVPITGDEHVSAQHCIFRASEREDGRSDIFVSNRSESGTFVNGTLIQAETLLHSGDVVRVGRTEIQLDILDVDRQSQGVAGGQLPESPSTIPPTGPRATEAMFDDPLSRPPVLEHNDLNSVVLGTIRGQQVVPWRVEGADNAVLAIYGSSQDERTRTLIALINSLPKVGVLVIDQLQTIVPHELPNLTVLDLELDPLEYNPLRTRPEMTPARLRHRVTEALMDVSERTYGKEWSEKLDFALERQIDEGTLSDLGDRLPEDMVKHTFGELLDLDLFGEGPPLGDLLQHRSLLQLGGFIKGHTAQAAVATMLGALTAYVESMEPTVSEIRCCVVIADVHLFVSQNLVERFCQVAARAGVAVIITSAEPMRTMRLIPSALMCFQLGPDDSGRGAEQLQQPSLKSALELLTGGVAHVKVGLEEPVKVEAVGHRP